MITSLLTPGRGTLPCFRDGFLGISAWGLSSLRDTQSLGHQALVAVPFTWPYGSASALSHVDRASGYRRQGRLFVSARTTSATTRPWPSKT